MEVTYKKAAPQPVPALHEGQRMIAALEEEQRNARYYDKSLPGQESKPKDDKAA